MSVLKINSDNFRSEVLESEKVVLLDFYADWCGPCRMLAPIIDEIAAENPNVTAHVYDIRHFEEIKNRHKVMSVPCLVINDEQVSFGKKNTEQVLGLILGEGSG